jgi:hypothetical protein
MTIEESRAQFEAAMTKHNEHIWLARYYEGNYKSEYVDGAWQGWELHRRTVSEGER